MLHQAFTTGRGNANSTRASVGLKERSTDHGDERARDTQAENHSEGRCNSTSRSILIFIPVADHRQVVMDHHKPSLNFCKCLRFRGMFELEVRRRQTGQKPGPQYLARRLPGNLTTACRSSTCPLRPLPPEPRQTKRYQPTKLRCCGKGSSAVRDLAGSPTLKSATLQQWVVRLVLMDLRPLPAGWEERLELASGDVPVHYRDGGVRHQRAAGAKDRVLAGGGSRTPGSLH